MTKQIQRISSLLLALVFWVGMGFAQEPNSEIANVSPIQSEKQSTGKIDGPRGKHIIVIDDQPGTTTAVIANQSDSNADQSVDIPFVTTSSGFRYSALGYHFLTESIPAKSKPSVFRGYPFNLGNLNEPIVQHVNVDETSFVITQYGYNSHIIRTEESTTENPGTYQVITTNAGTEIRILDETKP